MNNTNEAVLREALTDLIAFAEECEVKIDGEWGMGRTLQQIDSAGDLPESIVNARHALAATATVASADDTYMLKREIHNLKRHIEDYCPAPASAEQPAVEAMARRLVWLAFVWNDHNFAAAHKEARIECDKWGIKTRGDAEKFYSTLAAPISEDTSEEPLGYVDGRPVFVGAELEQRVKDGWVRHNAQESWRGLNIDWKNDMRWPAPADSSSAAPSDWKQAIFDACTVAFIDCGEASNAWRAIESLIAVHVDIALDPTISERAAALAAPSPTGESLSVPEGWKLVPIEPTDEMRTACIHRAYQHEIDEDWDLMLAAAPTVPGEPT